MLFYKNCKYICKGIFGGQNGGGGGISTVRSNNGDYGTPRVNSCVNMINTTGYLDKYGQVRINIAK